jgi:hypothetical protein
MSSVLLDARNEGLQHTPILSGNPVATRSIRRDDVETDRQTDHGPLELHCHLRFFLLRVKHQAMSEEGLRRSVA